MAKTIGIMELLEKVEDKPYIRHINVHDEKANKKYWSKLCTRLKRNMSDIDMCCEEDIKSYIEYVEEHRY